MGAHTRWLRPRFIVSSACVLAALAGGGVALAHTTNLNLTLKPTSVKEGGVYKATATGYVTKHHQWLNFLMVNKSGHGCPAKFPPSYSTTSGLTHPNGKQVQPQHESPGPLSDTVRVKATMSHPGAYSICAYLVKYGTTRTSAHASAVLYVKH